MSSKWNERLVTNFLKLYKQHPCLWNPYHKDYYNCHEKNEALQKIIDALGTPGFTLTDYLHQIKIIREKYKQEQMRTIKGLQSQKRYKSPFPWYNIVADMLTKVINDEEKVESQMVLKAGGYDTSSVLKSLSSDNVKRRKNRIGIDVKSMKIRQCTDATCNEIIRRSKSVEKLVRGKRSSIIDKTDENRSRTKIRYVPCPQFRKRENASRDKDEDTLSSHEPTRDVEPRTVEYSINGLRSAAFLTKGSDKGFEPPFLQCPSCGWEDAKRDQIERNVEKPTHEQRNFIPCSSYSRDPAGKTYTMCTGCNKVMGGDLPYRSDYTRMHVANSGDFEIFQDLSKQVPRPILTNKLAEVASVRSPVDFTTKFKKGVDMGLQCDGKLKKVSKDDVCIRVPVQTQVLKFDPAIANKFQGSTIEACLKITLSESKENLRVNATQNVLQSTKAIQCIQPESFTKETQSCSKNIFPEIKTIGVSVNTVDYTERGIQNTVCDGTRRCVSLQTVRQIGEKEKAVGRDSVDSMKSKEVAVNTEDRTSKGIQSTICTSRRNSFRNMSFQKIDIGTIMSTHQVRSVTCVATEALKRYQSNSAQCILTRSRSHESIKHCNRYTNWRRSVDKEIQEYEDPCRTQTCPHNVNKPNLIKEDSTIAFVLQQFLHNVLSSKREHGTQSLKSSSSNLQSDHEYKCHLKGNCTVDVTEMVKKIKEYTTKMLERYVTDFSKSKLNEFHWKFDTQPPSQKVEAKRSFTETEPSTLYATKPMMSKESDLKQMFHSTVIDEDKEQQTFENDKVSIKEMKKKLPSVDKEVSTYSNSKDVYTNGSLTRLSVHNAEIQSSSLLLKDSACLAKCEKNMQNRISVGTQKRDPILVRLIKCNESQAIVKSDKETLTARTEINLEKKSVDKRIETCGRSTCALYTISRKPNEVNLESTFHKNRENLMDNGYRKRSVTYRDYTCDENCKGKANCDWTDVTNIDVFSNISNSKIPLCIRSRKCPYAINK